VVVGTSLQTALAGLHVANAGIDLTSRNIANASDLGYTRKSQAQYSASTGQPELGDVRRIYDEGLKRTSRDAAANVGLLDAQQRYAVQVGFVFGAPGDASSLSTRTAALGDAFSALTVRPEEDIAYTDVINRAQRLAGDIRGLYEQSQRVATNAGTELSELIEQANQELRLVADLNRKITGNVGNDTTDLEDQRDRAIDSLAKKLDITAFKRPDGGISVFTRNGSSLVDAEASVIASVQVAGTGPISLVVHLATNGSATTQVIPRSGTMKGLLDITNAQVPQVQAQLDAFAHTLTTSLSTPGIGIELFNDGGATAYDPVATPTQTAGYGRRIAVNDAVIAAPQTIRDGDGGVALALGDTTYLDKAAAVFSSTTLAFAGPSMAAANSLSGAASDIITAQSVAQADFEARLKAEESTKSAIDALISAKSGVNVDVELSHLLELQQAYAANARIVSTTQSLFNTMLVAAGGTAVG